MIVLLSVQDAATNAGMAGWAAGANRRPDMEAGSTRRAATKWRSRTESGLRLPGRA